MNLVWLLAEIGRGGDLMGLPPDNAAVGVSRNPGILGVATDSTLMQEVEAFNKKHAGRLAPISDTLPR